MSYFKSWDLSDLAYAHTDSISQVNIELIDDGFHQNENFIFYRVGSKIEIFDRVCNHQGGRLFLSNDKGGGINMKEMGANIQIQLDKFFRIGNLLFGVYR